MAARKFSTIQWLRMLTGNWELVNLGFEAAKRMVDPETDTFVERKEALDPFLDGLAELLDSLAKPEAASNAIGVFSTPGLVTEAELETNLVEGYRAAFRSQFSQHHGEGDVEAMAEVNALAARFDGKWLARAIKVFELYMELKDKGLIPFKTESVAAAEVINDTGAGSSEGGELTE